MSRAKVVSNLVNWQKPNFAQIVRTNKDFKSNFSGAMLYVNSSLTSSDLKKEVLTYLKNSKNSLFDQVKDIDESRVATIGKYMYFLNHKADIPEDVMGNLLPSLERIIAEEQKRIENKIQIEEPQDKDKNKNTISIQDRLLERARFVAGEIEGWIDDFVQDKTQPAKTVEDFVNLYKVHELKAAHMRHMENIFKRRAEEIAEVAKGNRELAEGYSNFSKGELKKFAAFFEGLSNANKMLQESAKVERAPRAKKPVSQDKLVAKLKYKKDDSSLGIVSQNPTQIIGAKELWTYNTKTRKLAQYKAADERGLSIKGTSITNYSTDSYEKTLRKPAETLAEFKKASKVKIRTFLQDLSTVDTAANGKINENHILLRIST
jgi:hypothetical protein